MQDGKTVEVYDYDNAIREHVYIPNGLDNDFDGVEDRTSIEIMRPREPEFKIPAIVAPSPYYTSAPGQFVNQSIADLDGDDINDRWPLWYDNYFVPRGYAVILAAERGRGDRRRRAASSARPPTIRPGWRTTSPMPAGAPSAPRSATR